LCQCTPEAKLFEIKKYNIVFSYSVHANTDCVACAVLELLIVNFHLPYPLFIPPIDIEDSFTKRKKLHATNFMVVISPQVGGWSTGLATLSL
jgi:hypothetical protein